MTSDNPPLQNIMTPEFRSNILESLKHLEDGERSLPCECGRLVKVPKPLRKSKLACACGRVLDAFVEWGRWGGSRSKKYSMLERQKRRERMALARRKRW